MSKVEEQVRAEAVEWFIRLRDADDATWQQFTQWLEADPVRSDAYDAVALLDREIGSALPLAAAANDRDDGDDRRWRRFAWPPLVAGLAAALLLLVAPWQAYRPSARVDLVTAAGQTKLVALDGGGRVTMNGATRVVLDRNAPRRVELASGEALFEIPHDAVHPFEVTLGDHTIRDVGTVFNVEREGTLVSVGVVSGAVVYDPEGRSIGVRAGQRLRHAAGRAPILSAADPTSIGGWRKGQLSYSDEPLEAVVRELARTTGASIEVAPSLAALRFSGSIRVDSDRTATLRRFAAALGVGLRHKANGWILEPRPGAAR